MAKASEVRSTICASCGVLGPIQLATGAVCAACQSTKAWKDYAHTPLVVTRVEAEGAARLLDARPSRLPWLLHGAWAFLSLCLLGLASYFAFVALSSLEIAGLSAISDRIEGSSARAKWTGLGLILVGMVGAVSLWRNRKLRNFAFLTIYCAAIVTGVAAGLIGSIQGMGAKSDHIPFRSMPPLSQLDGFGLSPAIQKIATSTVVLLAPDKNGDARYSAIGTGAVIASTQEQAWVVTCSHVVIPYISTAAVRDPAETHKVWVEFSDSRGAPGSIVWTAPPPLDVAIVSIAISSPPAAVEISPSTELLAVSSPVLFIPNPLLHGWQVHYGEVAARKTHDTPAGRFALVHTSLPVVPGDSGSGLYDDQGRLVGLNTWTRYDEEGSHGISLPSEVLRTLEGAISSGRLKSLDSLVLPASATRESKQ